VIISCADTLLVHCVMGRSRSATLFLAFLMICEDMTVVDAIEHVKNRRRIVPNWGFLRQLRELDMQLLERRGYGAELMGALGGQVKSQVDGE